MKKSTLISLIAGVLLSGVWLGGCADDSTCSSDRTFEVVPTDMKFRADGQTRFVSVETDGEWSYGIIEPDGSRGVCRCEKTDCGLNVTMPVATEAEERYARVVVKARQQMRSVTVKQEGVTLEVEADRLEFGPEGDSRELAVTCNLTRWNFLVDEPEGEQGRCAVERRNNKLVVTVAPASGASDYEARIVVRAGSLSRKTVVRQAAGS